MRFHNGKVKLWTNYEIKKFPKLTKFVYYFVRLLPHFFFNWFVDSFIPIILIAVTYMIVINEYDVIWYSN